MEREVKIWKQRGGWRGMKSYNIYFGVVSSSFGRGKEARGNLKVEAREENTKISYDDSRVWGGLKKGGRGSIREEEGKRKFIRWNGSVIRLIA